MLYIGTLIVPNMPFRHKILVYPEVPSYSIEESFDGWQPQSQRLWGWYIQKKPSPTHSTSLRGALRLRLPPLTVVKLLECGIIFRRRLPAGY